MDINQFAALLARNNADEQKAIEGYYHLLAVIRELNLPKELFDQISEIIADEMQHSQVLSHWATRLSGIQPAQD